MLMRALLASLVLLAASSTLALGQGKPQVDAAQRAAASPNRARWSIDRCWREAATTARNGL
jgi:hypothetical protein